MPTGSFQGPVAQSALMFSCPSAFHDPVFRTPSPRTGGAAKLRVSRWTLSRVLDTASR